MPEKSTTIEFVSKAESTHGKVYDYTKINYVNARTPVSIICHIHGEFTQTPNKHLCGYGCPLCGYKRGKMLRTMTHENFLSKSKKRHGVRYDYSQAVYRGAFSKVCIICPKHGKFYQIPHGHLSGKGCRKCAMEASHRNFRSKSENQFLDAVGIPSEFRNKYIGGYFVDGYDPKTNTIYEFLGDYWHGNPKMFSANVICKSNGKTFGELYKHTLARISSLKSAGYIVKYVWESEWKRQTSQTRMGQQM